MIVRETVSHQHPIETACDDLKTSESRILRGRIELNKDCEGIRHSKVTIRSLPVFRVECEGSMPTNTLE
jgi:hypothetical protein